MRPVPRCRRAGVYVQGRATHEVNSEVAELQDNRASRARPDVARRAASPISGRAPTTRAAIARRTGDASNPHATAALEPANDCYAGFYLNVELPVDSANDDQTGAGQPGSRLHRGWLAPGGHRRAGRAYMSRRRRRRASILNNQVYLISNSVTGQLLRRRSAVCRQAMRPTIR